MNFSRRPSCRVPYYGHFKAERQRRGLKANRRAPSSSSPACGGGEGGGRGVAAFDHDGLDFSRAVATERRGFFILGRLKACDALLEGVEFHDHEAMKFLRTFHDLEAPAAGKHAAAVFGEDGRYAIGVLLVLGRIDYARTCDPIGGHVPPPHIEKVLPNWTYQRRWTKFTLIEPVRQNSECRFVSMKGSTETIDRNPQGDTRCRFIIC